MSTSKLQNIVVVGGGPAGVNVAHLLSAKLDPTKYNLIMITARPYYTHLPACIRMSVTAEGQLENRVHMPYEQNFVNRNGKYMLGRVVSVIPNAEEEDKKGGFLTLESGERVEYSVLILATGSTWEGPLAMPNTKIECVDWLNSWRERFAKAQHILLVGGGAVGIEYAGEIRDLWPNKKITLVHNEELLLHRIYTKRFRKGVMNRLRKRGIELILGDFVEDLTIPKDGTIITRNGRTIRPDLVIPCRGGRPNTEYLSTLGHNILTDEKYVRVAPTLQLFLHQRIFAGGDIIDWGEQKQEARAKIHARIIARNVIALLEGRQPPALYGGTFETFYVSVGRNAGASYFEMLWGLSLGDWPSSMIKSKNLFIDNTRKMMSLKA